MPTPSQMPQAPNALSNTTATVRLPKAQLASVTEGGKAVAKGNGITDSRQDGDAVVVDVGSGQYRFAYGVSR